MTAGRTGGGFRFRLESVRRLREWEKERRAAELARKISRVESLRRKLGELRAFHEHEWERIQTVGGSFDPVQTMLYGAYARRTLEAMAACRAEIPEAEREVDEARAAWTRAKQKLSLLDKLKEREWRSFERSRSRREQEALDEVAGRRASSSVAGAVGAGPSKGVRH